MDNLSPEGPSSDRPLDPSVEAATALRERYRADYGGDYTAESGWGSGERILVEAVNQAKAKLSEHLPSRDEHTLGLQDITDLAARGELNGHHLPEGEVGQGIVRSDTEFMRQRTALIKTYGQNPELARYLVQNEVVAMHGSTSGSLLPVLHQGLVPLETQREQGRLPVTGERLYASEGVRRGTSFMLLDDDLNEIKPYLGDGQPLTGIKLEAEISALTARMRDNVELYGHDHLSRSGQESMLLEKQALRAELSHKPTTEREQFEHDLITANFPVVYGIDQSEISPDNIKIPRSGIKTEFVVEGGISNQAIKIILVPTEQIALVKNMVEQAGLKIVVADIADVPSIRAEA